VRTYGDLVETVRALDRRESLTESRASEPPFVRVRVVRAADGVSGGLYRDGWLTPYNAEVILEDARSGGPGTRLEVSVPPHLTDGQDTELRAELAWLAARGVEAHVLRATRLHFPNVAA
jgi:hypothetical protein